MSKQQIAGMLFTESKDITIIFMDVLVPLIVAFFSIAFTTSLCLGLDPVYVTYTQGDI